MNTLNNSRIRQYIPANGSLVKFVLWEHYTQRNISPWSWMRVIQVNGRNVTVKHAPVPDNPDRDDKECITVPLGIIDLPIGWKPRYIMYVKPSEVDKVINDWFKRGIVVRANHEIGSHHGSTFQPLDNSDNPPHWRYPEKTDVIPAGECKRLIKVVKYEEEEITDELIGKPADINCPHCKGTGRRTITELAEIRKENIDIVRGSIKNDVIHGQDKFDPDTDTFECRCYYGALRNMGRTKRNKLFKSMAEDGWQVKYVRYSGGYWVRTRETIVHNWED